MIIAKIRSVATKIELDRAVLFGISAKVWSFIAGPVSAIIIISHFSPPLQGYYYTFSSLLALQVFAEIGLGTVTQQFASHEWSKLSLTANGEIIGDKDALSRLISLFRISVKWFVVGGGVIFVVLLVSGYVFFSTSKGYNIQWLQPWVLISFLTGIDIMFVPFWSLLEGCNQVKKLYGFRVLQGVLVNLSIWSSILGGLGLWAIGISSAVSVFAGFVFLRLRYYHFFKALVVRGALSNEISWKRDIFPMQWKIAVSWISGFFCFSLFTPVLFKYHGAAVAGKFGMTWSILTTLSGIANSWVAAKIPLFGIYAAKSDYKELDKLFFKIVKVVFLVLLSLSVFAWLFVYLLPLVKIKYAGYLAARIISPLPLAIFLLAQLVLYSAAPFSAYLRAHKTEPLMYISVFQSLLVALFTILLCPQYSVLGISIGYLISMCVGFPLCIRIWYKYRQMWLKERTYKEVM